MGSVQLQPNAAVPIIQKLQLSVILEDTTKVIKCVTSSEVSGLYLHSRGEPSVSRSALPATPLSFHPQISPTRVLQLLTMRFSHLKAKTL